MTAAPDRPTQTAPDWGPPWARFVAGIATLVPLGLAGTGLVTMATAVGSSGLQWMFIGLMTAIISGALALPLGVFLMRGGQRWFVWGLTIVVVLIAVLLFLAFYQP